MASSPFLSPGAALLNGLWTTEFTPQKNNQKLYALDLGKKTPVQLDYYPYGKAARVNTPGHLTQASSVTKRARSDILHTG